LGFQERRGAASGWRGGDGGWPPRVRRTAQGVGSYRKQRDYHLLRGFRAQAKFIGVGALL